MSSEAINNEWLTREEAAAYAKTTPATLAQYAYTHRGPKMYQPGGRKGKVLYRRSDLDAWLMGSEVSA